MKPLQPVFVKVISRKPIAFCPNEKDRNHLLAYVRETFECGHSKDYFFIEGAEPLTAKQRSCQVCFARVRRPKRVKAVKDAFGVRWWKTETGTCSCEAAMLALLICSLWLLFGRLLAWN
jgi:hypothetical protein